MAEVRQAVNDAILKAHTKAQSLLRELKTRGMPPDVGHQAWNLLSIGRSNYTVIELEIRNWARGADKETLEKAQNRPPGKAYSDDEVATFRDSLTSIIRGAPRVTNGQPAARLNLPLSAFKWLGLNAWAKACRRAQAGEFRGEHRPSPHTRHGRAESDRARQYNDDN